MARKSHNHSTHLLDRLAEDGIDTTHLSPIGVRPPFDEYLAELWQRRHFIWVDSRKRVASKYSSSYLGRLWLLLQPLLDAAFYGLIFGIILGAGRGVSNYSAFIVIGIMMFRSTSQAMSNGVGAISGAKPMIRAFSFPRASIPVSLTVRAAVESVPMAIVMMIMIMVIPPHVMPSTIWGLFPVIWVIQVAMNLGITLISARLGQLLPDASYIMTFISRLFMYGSGIMFPVERFLNHPTVLFLMELNPVYQVIDMYRTVLMDHAMPSLYSWIVVLGWTGVLLIGGMVFFWRGEGTYGR